MFIDGDLVSLFLYAVQQLGVMLGVGAQSVLLIAYLLSRRDGVIDQAEERFARAVERILFAGLSLIIISGVGAVAFHFLLGQFDVLFAPAFLFKWVLVLLIVVLIGIFRNFQVSISHDIREWLVGGTWYAIFLVHILAPVTVWENLLLMYVFWMVGFGFIWMMMIALVYDKDPSHIQKNIAAAAAAIKNLAPTMPEPKLAPVVVQQPKPMPRPEPKPAPTPTPPPKVEVRPAPPPVAPPPKIEVKVTPAPAPQPVVIKPAPAPVAPKPVVAATAPKPPVQPAPPPMAPQPVIKKDEKVVDPDENPGLPAIRVMPKTPEDLINQMRPSIVKLGEE